MLCFLVARRVVRPRSMHKAKSCLSLCLFCLMVASSSGGEMLEPERSDWTPGAGTDRERTRGGEFTSWFQEHAKNNLPATLGMTSAGTAGTARAATSAGGGFAQNGADWTEAFPAHRIVGNVYYVGSKGLGSYLITTPEGHILINSSLEASVPLIRESVEKLGFRFGDIKILLISHAHWDHCAGSAGVKELTGARYMVMDADVPVIESGGTEDFQYGNSPDNLYKPAKVDRVLHDGDEVKLGGVVLVAHKTPGHTKGCTTWTMRTADAGKTYDVVIVGSPNVNPGYKLVNNEKYRQIAQDYEQMFRVLKSLPCDVFLGAHGDYYGMAEKFARAKPGAANPFVDPEGYKSYVADRKQAFRAERNKQEEGNRSSRHADVGAR
jgi:metallo-beta-lactamase class B